MERVAGTLPRRLDHKRTCRCPRRRSAADPQTATRRRETGRLYRRMHQYQCQQLLLTHRECTDHKRACRCLRRRSAADRQTATRRRETRRLPSECKRSVDCNTMCAPREAGDLRTQRASYTYQHSARSAPRRATGSLHSPCAHTHITRVRVRPSKDSKSESGGR